jgi:hypothetical protein
MMLVDFARLAPTYLVGSTTGDNHRRLITCSFGNWRTDAGRPGLPLSQEDFS